MKSHFRSYINNCRESSQKDTFVKGFWHTLGIPLLEATDRSFGWTKGPSRHKLFGGMMILAIVLEIVVSGKGKLWKEWKRKNKQEEVSRKKEKG